MRADAVHQLVPSVNPGDATTGHTLQVQRVLREAGLASEVYALAVHDSLRDRVRLVGELSGESSPEGHLLYQFASLSELGDRLYGRREQIGLNYHNITPPELFHDWDRGAALSLRAGRVQLAQLVRRARFAVCVSDFNAEDLRQLGMAHSTVVPVLVDLTDFDAEPDPATTALLAARRDRAAEGASWLFVGAVAPHKAPHELVQALAVTRAVYDPAARLSIVGRPVSAPYAQALGRYVHALGLDDAVDVAGGVTHEQLVAYYRDADVYVSLSRHEGFCVPLLEAMHHGVPVVARAAGAVPSTLGVAGVLVDDRAAPHDVAAAVARVASDGGLRRRLVASGHARLGDFALERTGPAMLRAVTDWMAGAA